MTDDPVLAFVSEACEVTGAPGDFTPSCDLIDAAQVWLLDRCAAPLGRRALSLRFAAASGVARVGGKVFGRRRTAEVMGYSGIRLSEPMALRLAAFRAAA